MKTLNFKIVNHFNDISSMSIEPVTESDKNDPEEYETCNVEE